MKKKTQTFCEKFNELRIEAIKKITESGDRILFDISKDDMDNIWELPIISYVGRHSDYYTYAIVSYKVKGNKITFKAIETGETSDVMEFDVNDVELIALCNLADEL